MKSIITTVAFFINTAAFSFAQKYSKEEINFTDPIQVDSSVVYLIPQLIDDDDISIYGKGKGYLPTVCYSGIVFYNSQTGQVFNPFKNQRAIISPFFQYSYYNRRNDNEKEIPANLLPAHIIYLARVDNFNGDNALDTEDPVYLFMSTKTGEQLKQITPKGFHVLSWTLSSDKKMILVKGMHDTNGNKKFGNGDDQVYYRIDLLEDVSAIQCKKINF